jgi:hypothetical protein
VHHCRRKEVTKNTCPQQTEEHLHESGDAADRERHPIRVHIRLGILACRVSERLHGPQNDHDQPSRRPLDGEFGIADERRDESADDSREYTRDRRKTRRHRDAKTEREGDQKYEESRCDILRQVPDEPGCITARKLRIDRGERSTPAISIPRMSHALQILHEKKARES